MTRRRRPASARWRPVWNGLLLYLSVAAGTAVGGVGRALVSLAGAELAGPGFPWATLVANVVGSFVIGFYATLTDPDGRLLVGVRQRQFVMAGICGGFTTFSVFSLETFRLATTGHVGMAAVYVGASMVASLAAVLAGHALAARFNRLGG